MVQKDRQTGNIPDEWFKPKGKDIGQSRIGRQAIAVVLERCMATACGKINLRWADLFFLSY